jgi:hypothetical protein
MDYNKAFEMLANTTNVLHLSKSPPAKDMINIVRNAGSTKTDKETQKEKQRRRLDKLKSPSDL